MVPIEELPGCIEGVLTMAHIATVLHSGSMGGLVTSLCDASRYRSGAVSQRLWKKVTGSVPDVHP